MVDQNSPLIRQKHMKMIRKCPDDVWLLFPDHAGKVTRGDRKAPKSSVHQPRSPIRSTGKKKIPGTKTRRAGAATTSNVKSSSPSLSKAQKATPIAVAKETHLKDATPQISSVPMWVFNNYMYMYMYSID